MFTSIPWYKFEIASGGIAFFVKYNDTFYESCSLNG